MPPRQQPPQEQPPHPRVKRPSSSGKAGTSECTLKTKRSTSTRLIASMSEGGHEVDRGDCFGIRQNGHIYEESKMRKTKKEKKSKSENGAMVDCGSGMASDFLTFYVNRQSAM